MRFMLFFTLGENENVIDENTKEKKSKNGVGTPLLES